MRATVGGGDRVGGHHRPQCGEDLVRTPVIRGRERVGKGSARRARCVVPPARRGGVRQRRQGPGQSADQQMVRAVHAVVAPHGRDLDHGLPLRPGIAPADPHLDRIISQKQDAVGPSHQRHQDAVGFRRQTRASKTQGVGLVHQTLSLVGRYERNPVAPAEGGHGLPGAFVHGVHAGDGERPFRLRQRREGLSHDRLRRHSGRIDLRGGGRGLVGQAFGYADRYVDMHRTGLARHGKVDGLCHAGTDRPLRKAEAALDDWTKHGLVVEDLVRIALRQFGIDAAGQEDERHAILHRVGHDVDRVGHPWPQSRHQDRQGARHVPQPLGHEATAVLVLDQHEFESGGIETLHQRQNLAAGDSERMGGAGPCERLSDDVRARGVCACRRRLARHVSSTPSITPAA